MNIKNMPVQGWSALGGKKLTIFIVILIIGGFSGYFILKTFNPDFKDLSVQEMQKKIVKERDVAIAKAVDAGDYRCCIDPVCTMCFMEANKWNNFTAGTCACDDLIARGEEACPQCGRGLEDIHNKNDIFCDIDAEITTCNSTK